MIMKFPIVLINNKQYLTKYVRGRLALWQAGTALDGFGLDYLLFHKVLF